MDFEPCGAAASCSLQDEQVTVLLIDGGTILQINKKERR